MQRARKSETTASKSDHFQLWDSLSHRPCSFANLLRGKILFKAILGPGMFHHWGSTASIFSQEIQFKQTVKQHKIQCSETALAMLVKQGNMHLCEQQEQFQVLLFSLLSLHPSGRVQRQWKGPYSLSTALSPVPRSTCPT